MPMSKAIQLLRQTRKGFGLITVFGAVQIGRAGKQSIMTLHMKVSTGNL